MAWKPVRQYPCGKGVPGRGCGGLFWPTGPRSERCPACIARGPAAVPRSTSAAPRRPIEHGRVVNVHDCGGADCTRPWCPAAEPDELTADELERPTWLRAAMRDYAEASLLERALNPLAPYTAVLAVEEILRRVAGDDWHTGRAA